MVQIEKKMAEGTPSPEGASLQGQTRIDGQNLPASSGEMQSQASSLVNQPKQPAVPDAILALSPSERFQFMQASSSANNPEAMKAFKLEVAGGSVDDLRQLFKEGTVVRQSNFQKILAEADYLKDEVNRSLLSTALQAKYDQEVMKNRQEMADLINAGLRDGVLVFVHEKIRKVYEEITNPEAARRRSVSMYGESGSENIPKTNQERVNYINETLGSYQEDFWQEDDAVLRKEFGTYDIAALRAQYEGLSTYLARRVALAIKKELSGRSLDPNDEIGDFFLDAVIKTELNEKREVDERQRQRRRLTATAEEMLGYNDWRERFEFNWAETREELELSVFAWLEKFEKHLPNAAAQTVHEEAGKWRANAISALEKAAHVLGISEKEPFYERMRSTIESNTEVLGGVKLLESDGGFEAYTGYLEEFAHNFNAHHDSIYLGNAKSAIIQAYLARNHGEISVGAPKDVEKPQTGDMAPFRETIEKQAIDYATTHELYIKDMDFKGALMLGKEFREQTKQSVRAQFPSYSADQIEQMVDGIVQREVTKLEWADREENRKRKVKGEEPKTPENRRYWWDDDVIEELLLEDSRGMARANAITDPVVQAEAIVRVATRTGVFKAIKERVDDADGFTGLTEDQRRDIIRNRILGEMALVGQSGNAARINGITNQTDKDRALWNWLKEYNQKRERQGKSLFFPSNWDRVRLSINTSTKLIDRALSEGEFDAMIEETGSFKSLVEGVAFVTVNIDGLSEEDIKTSINSLNIPGLDDATKKELLEDALFNKHQREFEAERAFNINRNYQKFLGLDARWGGLTTRIVNNSGETELITVFEIAEQILKAKIDLEEKQIEDKVIAHENALIAAGTPADQIAEAKIWKRRLLRRDATFGVTLALRELGVANDLPMWNYDFFNDPKLVGTVAPYLGYRHGDKPKIADLIDKGRREMRAVFDFMADVHMDGKILVVREEPNLQIDANGQPKPYHEESWDRKRVINDGGEMALRDIFESRFMLSTSGGVEVPQLISKIGDLGIYDLLWEMGAKDFREFQGFIKRRDEVELAQQSLWNTKKWKDPISYAKRLRDAGAAKVYLSGGQTKEGYVHGALIEPLSGAYKLRDEFIKGSSWKTSSLSNKLIPQNATFREDLQQILENEQNFDSLMPGEFDKLVEVGYGVMKPLIDYLDHRRYVMNRGGRTPTNWKLDNELIIKAYLAEMIKRDIPEVKDKQGNITQQAEYTTLGSYHLDYAIQGRSKLALKIFKAILKSSSYHGLSDKEVDDLDLTRQSKDAVTKLTAKRQEIMKDIATNGLPAVVQAKINAREAKLVVLNTTLASLDKEKKRMKDEYIEEQVHKQVVGEWAASFADIASLPQAA